MFGKNKKQLIEERLLKARENGKEEARIQCRKETTYLLEEQKNTYELEISDLKSQLISAKI